MPNEDKCSAKTQLKKAGKQCLVGAASGAAVGLQVGQPAQGALVGCTVAALESTVEDFIDCSSERVSIFSGGSNAGSGVNSDTVCAIL